MSSHFIQRTLLSVFIIFVLFTLFVIYFVADDLTRERTDNNKDEYHNRKGTVQFNICSTFSCEAD